jgi:hypothetical protein
MSRYSFPTPPRQHCFAYTSTTASPSNAGGFKSKRQQLKRQKQKKKKQHPPAVLGAL